MAKGKHKPAPGAIRPDKVLHPQSRKVKKLHGKEVRKQKVSANATAAGQKLQQLGNFIMVHNDRNTKTINVMICTRRALRYSQFRIIFPTDI